MPTILVTGANRGLGLEFCRQYAGAGWNVLACCRNPASALELNALAASSPAVSVHALDVADFDAVDRLAKELVSTPIDILLCNAGVYGDDADNGFDSMDYGKWRDVFIVNTQAPVKLAEAFLGPVQRSSKRLIVAISSLMGSMADNSSGGSIMYRSSKAALNAAMKSLSLDLVKLGIGVLILHPGWVQTDMGGENAPTQAKDSIAGMRAVIEGFRLEDSGRFIDYRGNQAPW